jgi:hypothetical protein
VIFFQEKDKIQKKIGRCAVIILYYTAVELYTRTCTWLIAWLVAGTKLPITGLASSLTHRCCGQVNEGSRAVYN